MKCIELLAMPLTSFWEWVDYIWYDNKRRAHVLCSCFMSAWLQLMTPLTLRCPYVVKVHHFTKGFQKLMAQLWQREDWQVLLYIYVKHRAKTKLQTHRSRSLGDSWICTVSLCNNNCRVITGSPCITVNFSVCVLGVYCSRVSVIRGRLRFI